MKTRRKCPVGITFKDSVLRDKICADVVRF